MQGILMKVGMTLVVGAATLVFSPLSFTYCVSALLTNFIFR